ncbi:MAG TPA: hypothetical protein QF564_21315 [Pirellulaceae bacterium]|nr:hypothetical protein [Pirellulaceae bacterium]
MQRFIQRRWVASPCGCHWQIPIPEWVVERIGRNVLRHKTDWLVESNRPHIRVRLRWDPLMPDGKSLSRGCVLGGHVGDGRCVCVATVDRARFTPPKTPVLGLADNLTLTYVGPAGRKWP